MLCKDVFRLSTKAVDKCVEKLSLNRKKALWNAGLRLGPKKWAEKLTIKINELCLLC